MLRKVKLITAKESNREKSLHSKNPLYNSPLVFVSLQKLQLINLVNSCDLLNLFSQTLFMYE